MPAEAELTLPNGDGTWYDYAILRVVPDVERGEFINAGVILFSRTANYLQVRIELDEARLLALAPKLDLAQLRAHLATVEAVAGGASEGGPIAELNQSQRFHWLTSPRSTIIQTSPIHGGRCDDLDAALDDLLTGLVR